MRKSINGLAAFIKGNFGMDLFTQSLFLFYGKRHDRLKALLWESEGFELFNNSMVAEACLDRLVYNAIKLDLAGDKSMRGIYSDKKNS